MSVCVCFSLSPLQQRAKIHRSRRTEREKESVCFQKLRLFKGCLANTPTPNTPLLVSSSGRNFICAGFLYKLITPEGTSHYYRCWGGVVLVMVEHFHSRFTNVVTPSPLPPAPQPPTPRHTHIPSVAGTFS